MEATFAARRIGLMITRHVSLFCVATLALSFGVSSYAGGLTEAVDCAWAGVKKVASDIARDTKRRNCWPKPFVCPDRQAARAPFHVMVGHGWRQQNLIAHYHFDEEDGHLLTAGRNKIRWVLREAPTPHQTIYVQRADDPSETANRVDQVQQFAIELTPHGQLPLVVETDISPRGWSGQWVDAIDREWQKSIPKPVLPECSGDGS
jgi:hypothetical protein